MAKFETPMLNLQAGEGIVFDDGKFETNDTKQIEYLKQFNFISVVEDFKPKKVKQTTLEGQ